MTENIDKPAQRSRASVLLNWLKRNRVVTVCLLSAGGAAALLAGDQSTSLIVLNCLGAACVAFALSAYFMLYLINGPDGVAYLKRLIPALICGLLIVGLKLMGFAIPDFLYLGMRGFFMGIGLTVLFVGVVRG
jgi:hypothetical protein